MKSSRLIIIKLFIYSLLGFTIYALTWNLSYRQEPGLNKLAADFKVANRTENIDSMLKLYCLDGIDKLGITRLRGALEYELGLPIKKIQFEQLSEVPEETIEFARNGIVYSPTLEPRYRMRVTYMDENYFTSLFTIGKDSSGLWKIITTRPQPPPHY